MNLWSDSFADGEAIPPAFAFGKPDATSHVTLSGNRNPHLAWDDVPDGTKSFALIVHDYDVPSRPDDVNQAGRVVPADLPRVDFFHWVLFDLPADAALDRRRRVRRRRHAARQGRPDDRREPGRRRVARPERLHRLVRERSGHEPATTTATTARVRRGTTASAHHYVFTLYALDVDRLVVTGRVTGDAVREALAGHVLADATITGLYALNPDVPIGG